MLLKFSVLSFFCICDGKLIYFVLIEIWILNLRIVCKYFMIWKLLKKIVIVVIVKVKYLF